MTGSPPNDGAPIVALLCTRGMEAFLSNALHGMLRAGIDPAHILVACPPNAEETVRRVASGHSSRVSVLAEQWLTGKEHYSDFGSRSFNAICWGKIALIRQLLDRYAHVIYADLDIGWLRNPLPYLARVAQDFPIAFQTEGLPQYPPAVCCGFISLRSSDTAIAFLDGLLGQPRETEDGELIDDQTLCQEMIARDPRWRKEIFALPELLFVNGLGYRNLQDAPQTVTLVDQAQPFLLHANWTIGLDNKQKLLTAAGCWFEGSNPAAQSTAAPPALPPITTSQTIPALALTQHAVSPLHTLEYFDGVAFRWTHPAVLMHLAADRKLTISLETRNVRPGLVPSTLNAVVLGSKAADIELDEAGNVVLRVETPPTTSGLADVVLIAPDLVEPDTADAPGRRLGLPLFSVTIAFG